MAMRYLIRRSNPEDFADVKRDIPDFEKQLGKIGADLGTAGAHYRRELEVRIANDRCINYQFAAKKTGTETKWICPSIELVADDEIGLFALCDRLKTDRPSHLK